MKFNKFKRNNRVTNLKVTLPLILAADAAARLRASIEYAAKFHQVHPSVPAAADDDRNTVIQQFIESSGITDKLIEQCTRDLIVMSYGVEQRELTYPSVKCRVDVWGEYMPIYYPAKRTEVKRVVNDGDRGDIDEATEVERLCRKYQYKYHARVIHTLTLPFFGMGYTVLPFQNNVSCRPSSGRTDVELSVYGNELFVTSDVYFRNNSKRTPPKGAEGKEPMLDIYLNYNGRLTFTGKMFVGTGYKTIKHRTSTRNLVKRLDKQASTMDTMTAAVLRSCNMFEFAFNLLYLHDCYTNHVGGVYEVDIDSIITKHSLPNIDLVTSIVKQLTIDAFGLVGIKAT